MVCPTLALGQAMLVRFTGTVRAALLTTIVVSFSAFASADERPDYVDFGSRLGGGISVAGHESQSFGFHLTADMGPFHVTSTDPFAVYITGEYARYVGGGKRAVARADIALGFRVDRAEPFVSFGMARPWNGEHSRLSAGASAGVRVHVGRNFDVKARLDYVLGVDELGDKQHWYGLTFEFQVDLVRALLGNS